MNCSVTRRLLVGRSLEVGEKICEDIKILFVAL
jgi:hypothetical protein